MGEFAGVVVALGRVEYFRRFYQDVRPVDGTEINLMHRDGNLLAADLRSRRHWAGVSRCSIPSSPSRRRATAGRCGSRAPLDGADRFGALAPVSGYPLAVVVTRDTRRALEPWREQAAGTILLAAFATALMVLLSAPIRAPERDARLARVVAGALRARSRRIE